MMCTKPKSNKQRVWCISGRFTFLAFWHEGFNGRLEFSAVQQATLCLRQEEAQTLQKLHRSDAKRRRSGAQRFQHLPLLPEEVLNNAPEHRAPVPGQFLHQPGQALVGREEAHEGFAHAMHPAAAPRADERRAVQGVCLDLGHAFGFWIWVVFVVHTAEGAAAVQFSQGRSRTALQGQNRSLDPRLLLELGSLVSSSSSRCLEQERSQWIF